MCSVLVKCCGVVLKLLLDMNIMWLFGCVCVCSVLISVLMVGIVCLCLVSVLVIFCVFYDSLGWCRNIIVLVVVSDGVRFLVCVFRCMELECGFSVIRMCVLLILVCSLVSVVVIVVG